MPKPAPLPPIPAPAPAPTPAPTPAPSGLAVGGDIGVSGPFALDSDVNSPDITNVENGFTNRAQFVEDNATILGWMGGTDELEVFQVIAQSGGSVALELEIINHDGDSGDTTNNTDIDIYVVDTNEETIY